VCPTGAGAVLRMGGGEDEVYENVKQTEVGGEVERLTHGPRRVFARNASVDFTCT